MDLLSWNLRNGAVFEGDNIEAVLCPGAGQNSMIKESKNKKEAELFLDFIQRDDVLKIFEQYGFSINE